VDTTGNNNVIYLPLDKLATQRQAVSTPAVAGNVQAPAMTTVTTTQEKPTAEMVSRPERNIRIRSDVNTNNRTSDSGDDDNTNEGGY
jgi:hypothetical protein